MKQEPRIDSRKTAGLNSTYWIDTSKPLQFQQLQENISADVVVVGAGIAGLSVAYCLQQTGKSVIVVEDGFVGSGETGRTSAHLASALDDRYYEIERIFGEEGARYAAESHSQAIDFIEKTIKKEKIECGFKRVSGYLFLNRTDDEDSLEKEYESASKAGLKVKKHKKIPHFKSNDLLPCLEFEAQAQFHPLRYLQGLAEAFTKLGGKIFTETRAVSVDERGVDTHLGHRVNAAHVVIATNSPFNNKYILHLKQYPYRTYVIGATVPKGSVPSCLWWDTGDYEKNDSIPPYHYVRLEDYDDQYDLLIVGGEDHPTGLPEAQETSESASYARLEGWARARFDIENVVYQWSGQVLEPMDCLGYIGRNPMDKDNIYVVTGDSGNGLTHGTIAGLLIRDMITGKENPWEEIYRPARTNFFKSGKTFIKEFIGGFFQYLKHSPRKADEVRLEDIRQGDAQIIQLGKEKFGAYRDEKNDLHLVAATCTHAGCTVRWNSDEKSWDCPCHGSRFTMDGKILNGPAKEELLYIKEKAESELQSQQKTSN